MLTSKQKQYLKGLAHDLSPVVRIGKGGVGEAVVAETKVALEAHELIKVRVDVEGASERRPLVEQLARESGAEVAGAIGKIAILYRARSEKPKIKLP